MCGMATWYGGTIIDDVVPGHTGKGADFRLAEMKVGDYPGIYHMVEIEPEDWIYLPDVPAGRDSVNIDTATEDWLAKARLHHRPPPTGDLLRRGRQGDQLERHPAGRRPRRRRAPLGLPALLQGRPALDQLAGPVVRGHAAGDRRRPALAGRPRLRRPAPGRQRLPRRGEEHRGHARLVRGPPAVRGREPAHRQHGAQGRRLHLPRAEPHRSTTSASPPKRAPTSPTTSSTGPPTSTRSPPATPSSCGSRCAARSSSASTPPRSCTRCRTTTS